MGNNNSKTNTNTNTKADAEEFDPKLQKVAQIIDYIATHYILTMNFQNLKKLYEKDYCDRLVILTSEIIDHNFTPLEITYIANRVKNNADVTEQNKKKVLILKQKKLQKINSQHSTKKKRMCIEIAKFYITVAHIFAAIMTTINPVYVYKDNNGNTIKTSVYDKDSIPPNVVKKIYNFNICQTRIDSLKKGNDENTNEKVINIHPNVCSFNTNVATGQPKSLTDEPGIPELANLYFDEQFNPDTGQFLGMSAETKKAYEDDLKMFYNTFTDNTVTQLPENIKSFGDIKLKDYKTNKNCQGPDPMLEKNVRGTVSNDLFKKYAANIKQMITNANENQDALLRVINNLFSYSVNPATQEKEIRINPSLNEQNIHNIVVDARSIIMKLYLTCENDYTTGIKIYEAIVEQKILETVQSQIKSLNKLAETISFSNNDTDVIGQPQTNSIVTEPIPVEPIVIESNSIENNI